MPTLVSLLGRTLSQEFRSESPSSMGHHLSRIPAHTLEWICEDDLAGVVAAHPALPGDGSYNSPSRDRHMRRYGLLCES